MIHLVFVLFAMTGQQQPVARAPVPMVRPIFEFVPMYVPDLLGDPPIIYGPYVKHISAAAVPAVLAGFSPAMALATPLFNSGRVIIIAPARPWDTMFVRPRPRSLFGRKPL